MMSDEDFFAALDARTGQGEPSQTAPARRTSPGPVKGQAVGEWLRVTDACAYACVSAPTLRSWEGKGLRVYRPGRNVALVRRSELDAFIVSALAEL